MPTCGQRHDTSPISLSFDWFPWVLVRIVTPLHIDRMEIEPRYHVVVTSPKIKLPSKPWREVSNASRPRHAGDHRFFTSRSRLEIGDHQSALPRSSWARPVIASQWNPSSRCVTTDRLVSWFCFCLRVFLITRTAFSVLLCMNCHILALGWFLSFESVQFGLYLTLQKLLELRRRVLCLKSGTLRLFVASVSGWIW